MELKENTSSKKESKQSPEKYVIWHVQGGLGKNIAATALCEDLKKAHPDRKLIMVVSHSEIFLNTFLFNFLLFHRNFLGK